MLSHYSVKKQNTHWENIYAVMRPLSFRSCIHSLLYYTTVRYDKRKLTKYSSPVNYTNAQLNWSHNVIIWTLNEEINHCKFKVSH